MGQFQIVQHRGGLLHPLAVRQRSGLRGRGRSASGGRRAWWPRGGREADHDGVVALFDAGYG
jgi:hypothetical protein